MLNVPETMIPVDDASRVEASGLVELFVNPPEVDEDDPIRLSWNADIEGHGLIIYLFKGKREWVSSSVSKTPFSFLLKALNNSVDFTYLENVFVVRGVEGFPLSEVELKYVMSVLNERLKDTGVSSRLVAPVSAPEIANTQLKNALDAAVADLIDAFSFADFDVAEPEVIVEETVPSEELVSGSGELALNGLRLNVTSVLLDENNRESGLGSLHIRVTDAAGEKIVSFSADFS